MSATWSTLVEIFIILSLASIFPVSVIAYQTYQRPIRLYRLAADFQLLGYTYDEVKTGYDKFYSVANYLLFNLTVFVVAIIGLSLFFVPSAQDLIPNLVIGQNTLQAMRYGFLGAYIFSAHLVYRRYTTQDLQPYVYMNATLIQIFGLVFNYIAFEAVASMASSDNAAASGVGAGITAVVAFSLGYFPNLAIRWLNRLAFGALGFSQRRSNEFPLGLVDGISELQEARLQDYGIDNIQNLASVDISQLLMNSTFSAQQVVDWIDQAILYLYLDEKGREDFRAAGVRTFTDFRDQWAVLYEARKKGSEDVTLRKDLAMELKSTPEKLDILYKNVIEGANSARVLDYWHDLEKLATSRIHGVGDGDYEDEDEVHVKEDGDKSAELELEEDALKLGA